MTKPSRKKIVQIDYDKKCGIVFTDEDGKELTIKTYHDASGAVSYLFVEEL